MTINEFLFLPKITTQPLLFKAHKHKKRAIKRIFYTKYLEIVITLIIFAPSFELE